MAINYIMLCAWFYFFHHFFVYVYYTLLLFWSHYSFSYFLSYKDRRLLHNRTLWSTLCNTTCTVYTHTPHRLVPRYTARRCCYVYFIILLLLLSYIVFYPQRHCIIYIILLYIHVIHCVPIGIESFGVCLCIYILYIYI